MAHCTKCGAVVADNAGFCGSCGAAQGTGNPTGGSTVPAGTDQPGLRENLAATLSYALGWITGLIFYFTDKRPYVRFHAAQSVVVFGALSIIWWGVGIFFGMAFFAGGWLGLSFSLMIARVLELLGFVLWVLLMIKAYQGERFRVPIAADFAEKLMGKN